jgi:hypothetical protein
MMKLLWKSSLCATVEDKSLWNLKTEEQVKSISE